METASGKATATKYPEKMDELLAAKQKENEDLKAKNAALIKAAAEASSDKTLDAAVATLNKTAGGDRRLFADQDEV